MSTGSLSFITRFAQIQGSRSKQEDSLDVGVLVRGADGELKAYSCRYTPPPNQFSYVYVIVADGMGGHDDGEKASAAVVRHFPEALARTGNLEDAAVETNDYVADLKERGLLASSAGSTLVACLVHKRRLSTVSIGDSYILFQRGGLFRQENELHTRGAQLDAMVRAGEISAQEAAREPKRNALTCAVMGRPLSYCDYRDEDYYARRYGELQEDDRIFLMSDGVLSLGLAAIAEMSIHTAGNSPQKLVDQIISKIDAIGHPRQDNTTIVCLQGKCPSGKGHLGSTLAKWPLLLKCGMAATLLLLAGAGYAYHTGLLQTALSKLTATQKPESTTAPAGSSKENIAARPKGGSSASADKKDGEKADKKDGEKADKKDGEKVDEVDVEGDAKATEHSLITVLPDGALDIREGNKENLLIMWREMDRKGIQDKPQELLQLMFVWQETKNRPAKEQLRKELDSLVATISDTSSPDLRLVKAYYLWRSGQESWLEAFSSVNGELSKDAPDNLHALANYLKAVFLENLDADQTRIKFGWAEGKLACLESDRQRCLQLARLCTKEALENMADDVAKANMLASLAIAAEEDEKAGALLKDATAADGQPNTRLLLCYRDFAAAAQDWDEAFYKFFIKSEVATADDFAVLRNKLTRECANALLQSFQKEKRDKQDKIAATYHKLEAGEQAAFLIALVGELDIRKLAGDLTPLVSSHENDHAGAKGNGMGGEQRKRSISNAIKGWHKTHRSLCTLFIELLAGTPSGPDVVPGSEAWADSLAVLALHLVAEGGKTENAHREYLERVLAKPLSGEHVAAYFLGRCILAQLHPKESEGIVKEVSTRLNNEEELQNLKKWEPSVIFAAIFTLLST